MDNVTRPIAFVIMPFAPEFDQIYNLFVAESLAEAGYSVVRADDVGSSQNIIKDIIRGIASAQLVVADLTTANPNVYYELGIAHALRTPVILLAQDMEEIPFDLRTYRVLVYDTNFAKMRSARAHLVDLAKKLLSREVPFGNPVIDFLPSLQIDGLNRREEAVDDEMGFLDYMVGYLEGMEGLGKISQVIGEKLGEIGSETASFNDRLRQPGLSPRQAHGAVVGFAAKLDSFASYVAEQNELYRHALSVTRTCLERYLQNLTISSPEDERQARELLDVTVTAGNAAKEAEAVIASVAVTVRSSPNAERTYSRACSRTANELKAWAQNIEQSAAMFSRAENLIVEMLARAERVHADVASP